MKVGRKKTVTILTTAKTFPISRWYNYHKICRNKSNRKPSKIVFTENRTLMREIFKYLYQLHRLAELILI